MKNNGHGGEKQVTIEWVIISDTIDKDNYILALTDILKRIEKTSICQWLLCCWKSSWVIQICVLSIYYKENEQKYDFWQWTIHTANNNVHSIKHGRSAYLVLFGSVMNSVSIMNVCGRRAGCLARTSALFLHPGWPISVIGVNFTTDRKWGAHRQVRVFILKSKSKI